MRLRMSMRLTEVNKTNQKMLEQKFSDTFSKFFLQFVCLVRISQRNFNLTNENVAYAIIF
jgi:hypothetical protein